MFLPERCPGCGNGYTPRPGAGDMTCADCTVLRRESRRAPTPPPAPLTFSVAEAYRALADEAGQRDDFHDSMRR